MRVIDRARAHFSGREPREITVPQWRDADGKPTVIYFHPMTVKQRQYLIDYEKKNGSGLKLLVETLVKHARDAAGDPLFSLEDKPLLMNGVDPDVIQRIGSLMIDDDPDIASIKKKSSPTGSSGSA